MEKKNNFLIVCIMYMAAMLLLIVIRFASGMGWLDDIPDKPLEIGFSFVSQLVIMFAVPYIIYRLYDRKRRIKNEQVSGEIIISAKNADVCFADFNFRKISAKYILLAFAAGIMLYILNVFVAGFFYGILDEMGYRFSVGDDTFTGWWGFLITLLLSCVLPGFCEEFTHRGYLLTGFQTKFTNYRAVMCVSILFGLMHMNIQQFFYAAVLGWFICMAVISSRSVWVGVIIHFTNNAISTYLGFASDLNLPGLSFIELIAGSGFLLVLLILVLLVSCIGLIMRYMAKENFERNKKVFVAKYIALHSGDFSGVDFERVTEAVERAIALMPIWKSVFAYCETNEKPQKLTPLEKSIFVSLFVLGGLITMFTLQWGLL